MKLRRVGVEHFACIRKAEIDLGPGLNVLYGPNDLGKSTLAQAIRAALLLQHTSSAADAFIEWDSDEHPKVNLTFEVDRRFWKVEKTFGSPGASLLSESNDDLSFTVRKKGREVDDELRSMLGWGIAAPGGAGAPRGLPPSFLASVLLGEQADVAGILRATLEADSDESGRTRLTAALEAFAQDPLFKAILDDAQAQVDAAFTPKGKRKRDRASPFRAVTEDVKRVKEALEEIAKRVAESDDAAKRLEQCHARVTDCAEQQRGAVESLARLQSLQLQFAAVQAAEQNVSSARGELARIEQEVTTLSAHEAALRELNATLQQAQDEKTDAEQKQAEALALQKSAEDNLRRAQGDDAEKERRIQAGDLGKERLELEAKLSSLRVDLDALGKARAAETHLKETEDLRARAAEERDQLSTKHDGTRTQHQDIDRQLESLEIAARLRERQDTQKQINVLESVRAEIESDHTLVRDKRNTADALEAELPAGAPTPEEVDALQRLRQQVEVAEARLGGGLAVAIERLGEHVAIDLVVDGTGRVAPSDGSFTVEAERAVGLRIGDLAGITITAGEKDVRAAADALAVRWKTESEAIFARAGVSTLEDLTKLARKHSEATKQIQDLKTSAAGIEGRIPLREAQLKRLPDLERELAASERELAGTPTTEAEALLTELGDTSLEDRRAKLRTTREALDANLRTVVDKISESDKTLSALDERLNAARRAVEQADAKPPAAGWDAEIARVTADITSTEQQRDAVTAALGALTVEHDADVKRCEAAVIAANDALQIQTALLDTIATKVEKCRNDVFALEAEIKVRREQTAQLDLEAARALMQAASDALDALHRPDREVGDAEIAAANAQAESAERAYETANDEARKAEGALQMVGGQVVREAEETAKEALRVAEQKERDVERDYDAWLLLVEKLREAEDQEGQHLGEALSVPVSQRFAALTGGRYGKLEVTPQLRTDGVNAAGALRATTSLSVGTQEQLATLLRLTVAEVLGTVLVLDDHLTQTDPARSKWFVDVLREHADKAQIVVLTCRPLDYVREEDLSGEQVSVVRAGGLVNVVDLSRVIMRGGAVSVPANPG